jgi:RNA 2',3'-cyclic 3'-phosphodiesterase
MPVKTHHTAVVAMPPPEVWEPIQAIRRQYDRHVHRWMPHITLLYPFVPHVQFDEILPGLIQVGRQSAALQVTLATFQAFRHGFGKATIWLAPEPRHALVTLQAALHAAFPAYNEQSRFPTGFTPHLSVGQASSPRGRQYLLETLQATWQPVQFTLTALTLIWREADGPFQIAHTIPLEAPQPLPEGEETGGGRLLLP